MYIERFLYFVFISASVFSVYCNIYVNMWPITLKIFQEGHKLCYIFMHVFQLFMQFFNETLIHSVGNRPNASQIDDLKKASGRQDY